MIIILEKRRRVWFQTLKLSRMVAKPLRTLVKKRVSRKLLPLLSQEEYEEEATFQKVPLVHEGKFVNGNVSKNKKEKIIMEFDGRYNKNQRSRHKG